MDSELTAKGDPFQGTIVSRRTLGDLTAKIVVKSDLHSGESLGVHKPSSDGDKPYFM